MKYQSLLAVGCPIADHRIRWEGGDRHSQSVLTYRRFGHREAELGGLGARAVTFIDWSDAEGMFGLFIDLVADERMESQKDPARRRFLEDLLARLQTLEARLPRIPMSAAIQELRHLHDSADPEFAGDAVMVHLQDCIEELERVANGG